MGSATGGQNRTKESWQVEVLRSNKIVQESGYIHVFEGCDRYVRLSGVDGRMGADSREASCIEVRT